MTDPAIYAAATVTVIAAIAGGVVSIINAFAAAQDRRDSREERRQLLEKATLTAKSQEDTSRKADAIIEQGVAIHTLTNDANSKLQSAVALLTEKNTSLQRVIDLTQKSKDEALSVKQDTDLAAARLLRPPDSMTRADDPVKVEITNIPHAEDKP
jgi:hypothetical protein